MAKLSEKQKTLQFEKVVLTGTVEDIKEIAEANGPIEMKARSLGMACRFRGLDFVKTLVELGFSFCYTDSPAFRGKYDCGFTTAGNYKGSSDYLLLLLDDCKCQSSFGIHGGYKDLYTDEYKDEAFENLRVISEDERSEIIEYLFHHKKEARFNAKKLLYYSILSQSDFAVRKLKSLGVTIPEEEKKYLIEGGSGLEFQDYQNSLCRNDPIDLKKQFEYWLAEIKDNQKIVIYNAYAENYADTLFCPEVYAIIKDRADFRKKNKKTIMKKLVLNNNASAVSLLCDNGWVEKKTFRDDLIDLANEKCVTETIAVLIEYKNKSSDPARELAEEEAKREYELNMNPNSVAYLKKIWSYEKLDDGTLRIKKYKGTETTVTVPEKIGKAVVSTIGYRSFSPESEQYIQKTKITPEEAEIRRSIVTINLPDTITQIEEYAFYHCASLQNCKLPDALTYLGRYAFCGTALKTIVIPDSLTQLPEYVFEDCKALESVDLGCGLEELGRAFYNCDKLSSVQFGNDIPKIDSYAFDGTEWFSNLGDDAVVAGKYRVAKLEYEGKTIRYLKCDEE